MTAAGAPDGASATPDRAESGAGSAPAAGRESR
ncbi:hypothetical protein HNR12_001549 [Streptomonospora nanhaiensis]|uniref:Uncharacterized protein n=1 Tax=Streptomonospora nanhaiensis TaxID=1323731 RepID=A0A853BL74_9ACTN|nr:hypothetical protein [Streptomonospora nanhaiensis]